MAKLNIQHPLALLGRTVKGTEVSYGHTTHFSGVVECVAVQRGDTHTYSVEVCINGDFISVDNCIHLQYTA